MTRRYYANAAPQLTLTAGITNSATSCTVTTTFVGWPASFPFFAGFADGTANFEVVLVTNIVGSTATITRAQNGTAAVAHSAGTTLDQVVVAQDFDEASAHINATTGVHGVTGALVDTGTAQTLNNKTLNAPVITGGLTLSGTQADSGSETIGGTLAVAGATTLAAVTATTVHATGAVTLDTTLSVVGALTVAGAVRIDSHGALSPASFANEAARDAAITAPVNGMIVHLSAPTGLGLGPGLFVRTSGGWKQVRPRRIGARAVTSMVQSTSPTGTTISANDGGASWSPAEISDPGFIDSTSGTIAPVVIPAGLDGLYAVGCSGTFSAVVGTRGFVQLTVNGSQVGLRGNCSGDLIGFASGVIALSAGDTLGMQFLTTNAVNLNTGSFIYAYRIGD